MGCTLKYMHSPGPPNPDGSCLEDCRIFADAKMTDNCGPAAIIIASAGQYGMYIVEIRYAMKRFVFFLFALLVIDGVQMSACTGIALRAKDGSFVVGRTVEWAASAMECGYVVSPRGHRYRSFTPQGEDGLEYVGKYGFVGIYTEYAPFVVEGLNERGLSVGLFFFPGYGEYPAFDAGKRSRTLCDMQFVSWALSQFDSIDELKRGLERIELVSLDHRIGSVHWRISEPGGKVAVLEFVDGKANFYDNPLGVLANSPGFDWHLTNLGNYVNLKPGAADPQILGDGLQLRPIGGGSAMLGLPGDFTPPSRFVRAVFLQETAPQQSDGYESSMMAFHLLNNFDVPVGMQVPSGKAPEGLQSATQFTSVSDLSALKLYYRTAWNSTIRCFELDNIDFSSVIFQTAPLDKSKEQPVELVDIGQ